jgi:pimeloyl-ACP methyl ester carboxylesterase
MGLACDDLGQGTPVVCLPPFSLDRSIMAAAMEPVLARRAGLRRIYVDLPGHGESPAGEPAINGGFSQSIRLRESSVKLIAPTATRFGYGSWPGWATMPDASSASQPRI